VKNKLTKRINEIQICQLKGGWLSGYALGIL